MRISQFVHQTVRPPASSSVRQLVCQTVCLPDSSSVRRGCIVVPSEYLFATCTKLTKNVSYSEKRLTLFCFYLENELSYRAGIGPKWKLFAPGFQTWYNYSDSTQSLSHYKQFFATWWSFFTFFGLTIHLVLLISREWIKLHSWDCSQMKALCSGVSDLI